MKTKTQPQKLESLNPNLAIAKKRLAELSQERGDIGLRIGRIVEAAGGTANVIAGKSADEQRGFLAKVRDMLRPVPPAPPEPDGETLDELQARQALLDAAIARQSVIVNAERAEACRLLYAQVRDDDDGLCGAVEDAAKNLMVAIAARKRFIAALDLDGTPPEAVFRPLRLEYSANGLPMVIHPAHLGSLRVGVAP
jgi:hypothetical protein